MNATLDQISIVAGDVEATVAFYRMLGVALGDPARTSDGEPFHVSSAPAAGAALEADSPRFARVWNRAWAGEKELAGRVVIGLRIADRAMVDRLAEQVVEAGYRVLHPPHDAFRGARYAIVEDPNGVAVGLMSPADHAHRSPPTF